MPTCPKIRMPAGSDVAIVEVTGDPSRREPASIRITFPGGEVELVRATDGLGAEYWVHLRIERADDPHRVHEEGDVLGRVSDARLDIRGKHASESNAGDFSHQDLYHLAVRVSSERV